MKVLVIGGGGREHCLCHKISQSPRVKKIYAAPGNAGTEDCAERVGTGAEEIDRLADFAAREKIDLTVAGPEAPLAAGIADRFSESGLRIFGPSARAAKLESSKVFCKEFLERNGIPAAHGETFDDPRGALSYIESADYPLVVKADGLCAGKGVVICAAKEDAREAVREIMEEKVFSSAGEKIVVEEFLTGEEVSFMAVSDGESYVPLLPSQDHKAAYEGDKGPNTGGMGAYAPARILNSRGRKAAMEQIIEPALRKMAEDGTPYRGVLYGGLILTSEGPKVLEFNARFGDPETQAVLPLLNTDIVELMEAAVEGSLKGLAAEWKRQTAVCVVMASRGYPGKYEKGKKITGIDKARESGALVFHAGTERKNGELVTAGGRVLGVTALAGSVQKAIDSAYLAVRNIKFEGAYYREDIGWKALRHAEYQGAEKSNP